jgi:glycosyltransferase involved in cell wall biosynthesis
MPQQDVFFSIVIPTYNRGPFILNTLNSVFQQTFDSYEIIVVDNASTDNTQELLKPLVAEGRIKSIVHDKNYERAKSRNTGQENASGRYLTFLDSDDFMYPGNLMDAFEFVKAKPECKIFHNLYELVDDNQKTIYRFKFRPLINPRRQICEGNFLSCIGVFIHKEIYRSLFWDETPELVGSEDYEFWIRIIARYPNVGRINKVNSGILHHDGRTMNNIQLQSTKNRFDFIIKKVETTPELNAVYHPYINKLKAFRWLFLGGLSRSTNYYTTLKFLFKALNTDFGVLFSRNFYSHLLFLTIKPFKK